MPKEIDARILSESYLEGIRKDIDKAIREGADRPPRIDIFQTEGSSKQFLRSIERMSESVGITVVTHDISLKDDPLKLLDNLIKLMDSGETDGIIFIRPPYSPDIIDDLSMVNVAFVAAFSDHRSFDIDRIGYIQADESYPPVAEAVSDILDYANSEGYIFLEYSWAAMLGSSPYVGMTIYDMLKGKNCEEVFIFHTSDDPEEISQATKASDIVCTYRDVDDLELNKSSLIVDIGNDDLFSKVGDRVAYCTTHLGQLTTAILLRNLKDNYLENIN